MVIGFSTINHTHILGHPHFVHSATRLHDGQSGPPGIRLPCSREHFGSSAFEPRFKGTSAGNPHHLWQRISTLFPVPPSPKVSKSPKFIQIPKRFPNFGPRVMPFEVQNMFKVRAKELATSSAAHRKQCMSSTRARHRIQRPAIRMILMARSTGNHGKIYGKPRFFP